MKWPLVLRSTFDTLMREKNESERVRIDLEGSNNALRQMHRTFLDEIRDLKKQLSDG